MAEVGYERREGGRGDRREGGMEGAGDTRSHSANFALLPLEKPA